MSDATEEGAAHHRPGRKRVAFFQFCDPFATRAAGSFHVGIGTNEVECDLERYLFIPAMSDMLVCRVCAMICK
jgi:hypothetical protein